MEGVEEDEVALARILAPTVFLGAFEGRVAAEDDDEKLDERETTLSSSPPLLALPPWLSLALRGAAFALGRRRC